MLIPLNRHFLGAYPGPGIVLYGLNSEMNKGRFLPPGCRRKADKEMIVQSVVRGKAEDAPGSQEGSALLAEHIEGSLEGMFGLCLKEFLVEKGFFSRLFLPYPPCLQGICFGWGLPLDYRVERNMHLIRILTYRSGIMEGLSMAARQRCVWLVDAPLGKGAVPLWPHSRMEAGVIPRCANSSMKPGLVGYQGGNDLEDCGRTEDKGALAARTKYAIWTER